MIHKFSVVIELSYDDEDGEYEPPTLSNLERVVASAIHQPMQHWGFDKAYNVEAAKGHLKSAFGVG